MTEPKTDPMTDPGRDPHSAAPDLFQMGVDFAPVAAFAVTYFLGGKQILTATFALVAGSVAALLVNLAVRRKFAVLPTVYGGAALIFGTLTLVFKDPSIVKMKTTFIDAGLGIFLLGGMALKKNPIRHVLSGMTPLSERGWRLLTLRFGLFFLATALMNEIVWRTQPEHIWVVFRMPGLLILSLIFAAFQTPLILKEGHVFNAPPAKAAPDEDTTP